MYPDRAATFAAGENIIVGNVCLYGATKARSSRNPLFALFAACNSV